VGASVMPLLVCGKPVQRLEGSWMPSLGCQHTCNGHNAKQVRFPKIRMYITKTLKNSYVATKCHAFCTLLQNAVP
jgi:hypothetical protein